MKRVFLIEDDGDYARELAAGLRDLGYTVGMAEGLAKDTPPDRGKILAQAESFCPDRVILDLDLGDGLEQGKRLLSELRRSPVLAKASLDVLSVHVSLEENAGSREMKSAREEVQRQRGAGLVLHKSQIGTRGSPDAAKLVALWPKGAEPVVANLPRVLVLEDSPGDVERYQQALQDRAKCLFLSPVQATDELMKTIREFDPALIVVDLMLGGEINQRKYPGARIIKTIREDSRLKGKHIVVCSKYISPEDKNPSAPDVPPGAIDKALPKFPFPTADDLLSPLQK